MPELGHALSGPAVFICPILSVKDAKCIIKIMRGEIDVPFLTAFGGGFDLSNSHAGKFTAQSLNVLSEIGGAE